MPDNPIHTFFQILGGSIPDLLSLGGYRWFEVVLYWALLIGSLTIAYANWRMDETQRTGTHISIYAMRLVSAGMWYLGTLWKLPLPVSTGFQFWLENTVKYSSFHVHASIMQVFLDHIALAQPLVFLLETALAVSLMLGFMVRLAGVVGALFILNLLIGLYNDPTEWPWTYVGIICSHGMFAVAQAGRSFGIDNLLAKRLIPGLHYDGLVTSAIALAS
ncbi:MAG TPA: TQO small subunit DoxD [Acetobacteraceae bacterium]|nr:TQO small subunit DoxD [Acetobacteraceae bacterium]